MLNIKSIQVATKKYERESSGAPRGQNFQLKYRAWLSKVGEEKAEKEGREFKPFLTHEFRLSNKLFEKLDLANHSLGYMGVEDEDGNAVVALIVLPEAHPTATAFVQKGKNKKNPYFKHDALQAELAAVGAITAPFIDEKGKVGNEGVLKQSQKLDLEYAMSVTVDAKGNMEPAKKDAVGACDIYVVVADKNVYAEEDESDDEDLVPETVMESDEDDED